MIMDDVRTAAIRKHNDNLSFWDEKTDGWFTVCGCNLLDVFFSFCVHPAGFPAFVSSLTLLLLLHHLWVSPISPSFPPYPSLHAKHLPVFFLRIPVSLSDCFLPLFTFSFPVFSLNSPPSSLPSFIHNKFTYNSFTLPLRILSSSHS